MSFIWGVITFCSSWIIRLLFMLVSFMYSVIVYLANIDLFNVSTAGDGGSTLLTALTTRIYVLLGIFMLFRVGFSMLMYLINPDKMADKNSGIGKLIQRAIVALIILVLFQPALSWIMKFQNIIISSNVLGSVILGVQGDNKDNMQQNFGEILPSTVIISMTSIGEGWDQENGNHCKDLPTIQLASSNDACREAVEKALGNNDKYSLENLQKAENWQRWFDIEVTTAGAGLGFSGSVFSNNPFLMIIIAIAFIVCLFSLGLQLGVRIIKLGFLAMIAPIPIISYIEPSQGKNGMLGKWAKEFAKTYLMLFIRLAALYFAILIVIIVYDTGFSNLFAGFKDYQGNSLDSNPLIALQVKVIIMIAAFIFADQVPKLLENIFNLKSEGGMFKNPFKQMRESKALTGTIGGAAGLGLGAIRSAKALGGKKGIINNFGKFKKGLDRKFGAGWSKDKAKAAMKGYRNLGGKAVSAVGNVGRSAKKTAKDLQENKQGMMEGIRDSQKKAAEEGYNRTSRVGTNVWDQILGNQFPLKELKAKLEKISKAAGAVTDTAADNMTKKDRAYQLREKEYERKANEVKHMAETGKTKELEAAESKLQQVQSAYAQKMEAQKGLVSQKNGLQQENANLISKKQGLDGELTSLNDKLKVAADVEAQKIKLNDEKNQLAVNFKNNKDAIQAQKEQLSNDFVVNGMDQAEYNAKSQELDLEIQSLEQKFQVDNANLDAQLGNLDAQLGDFDAHELEVQKANLKTEIDQIDVKVKANETKSAQIDVQIQDAITDISQLEQEVQTATQTVAIESQDVENKIKDAEAAVVTAKKDFEDYKKVRTGKVENRWLMLYELANERYNGDVEAMEVALKNDENLRDTLAREVQSKKYFIDTDLKDMSDKHYENLFEIDNETKSMLEQLTNLSRAHSDDPDFQAKIRAYQVATEDDYKNIRAVFKDDKEAADAKIVQVDRDLDEMEKGTRGVGDVDETINMGDF